MHQANLKGLSKALFKELSIHKLMMGLYFLQLQMKHIAKSALSESMSRNALTDRTGKAWKVEIILQPSSNTSEKLEEMTLDLTKKLKL